MEDRFDVVEASYDENEMIAELRAAGYTEAQISKEIAYIARLEKENAILRKSREANYGFF